MYLARLFLLVRLGFAGPLKAPDYLDELAGVQRDTGDHIREDMAKRLFESDFVPHPHGGRPVARFRDRNSLF